MITLNPMHTNERFSPEAPDGRDGDVPFYLLNTRLHKPSLKIDYGLCFVKYIPEQDLDMYILDTAPSGCGIIG